MHNFTDRFEVRAEPFTPDVAPERGTEPMLEWRFAALSTLVALLLSALLVAYLVLDMSSYAIAFYVEQRALDIGLAIAVFATVAFALRRDRFGLTWATLTSTGLYVLSSFLPMR